MYRIGLRAAALAVALGVGLAAGTAVPAHAATGAAPAASGCELTVENPKVTGFFTRKVTTRGKVMCSGIAFEIRLWVWLTQLGVGETEKFYNDHLVDRLEGGASRSCQVGWYQARARGYWEIGPIKDQQLVYSDYLYVDTCD